MKKKNSRPRKKPSNSLRGPFFAGHSFNGIPFEVRQRAIAEHGQRQRERFKTMLPQIVNLISEVDPLNTLALISSYGLMGTPEQQGSHKASLGTSKIQQGHVEFLQAICLRNRLESERSFPDPQTIQDLFDTLPELFGAYQAMRLDSKTQGAEGNLTEHDAGIIQLQELMRAHTSVVRNWGYFGNVTRISKDLLSRIDNEYERHAGMKLSKIVDIFEGLVRRHEKKINEHLEMLHSIFSLRTKAAILEQFFTTFEFKGATEDFRRQLANANVTTEQAKYALLPLSDRFIGPTLLISNQELADEFSVDLDAVRRITKGTSLAFADLVDHDPEHFFLNNPVWLRPLIYLQEDIYFCALPQTLLSFVFPIAEELLAPFEGLPAKLSNVRSEFLEDEVARLSELAFPGCERFRGFKWREGSQQFESDLVIRFDTTLILIESKSGRISWPALRGAPSRLLEHIKKLIVEPSDQSGRLAQRLEEDILRLKNNEQPTLNFPLPLRGVTCVVRLSVMLHDFATIQSVPAMLASAGLLQNKYPLAPCISLADLDVMLDMLDTPYFRLHYIRQRAELLMKLRTIGDELDMLGMYLDTAMNLGAIQATEQTIITSGYSVKIDRYYSLKDESLPCKKPKPSTSQWFKRLCAQLEERSRPGWSEIACALLSISPSDQAKVERGIRRLSTRARAGKPLKDSLDAVMLVPPEWTSQAVAFQIKLHDGTDLYGSDSHNIAQKAFESAHVKRCIVLVVDAMDINLSYLSAAMFVMEDADSALFY